MGVQADWSRKHRTMSRDLAIGVLSEQEIRCIKEMRQQKVHDCDDNLYPARTCRKDSKWRWKIVRMAIIGYNWRTKHDTYNNVFICPE
jgi:hypothetical protein